MQAGLHIRRVNTGPVVTYTYPGVKQWAGTRISFVVVSKSDHEGRSKLEDDLNMRAGINIWERLSM